MFHSKNSLKDNSLKDNMNKKLNKIKEKEPIKNRKDNKVPKDMVC